MNFKKRLKQAICISAAVAVSFTCVYAEDDETSEVDDNYFIARESYMAYKLFENLGYKPGATVLNERQILKSELVSSGELSLNGDGTASFSVSLDSVTTDDGSTITINETTDLAATLGSGYQTANSSTYITVPALTFKTVNTTNNYSTVSNTIACNKTGTYGTWTGNTAGTSGTITYPNYSCTFSPYEKTTSDSFRLDAQNLNFSLSQRQITGTNTTTGEEVINLDIDTTGSITGTLTFDLEGTLDFDTTGNIINDVEHSWIYNYPIMILNSSRRAVINSTFSFNNNYGGYPFIISFIATNSFNVNDFNIEPITSGNVTPSIILKRTIKSANLPGFNKVTIVFVSDTPSSSFYFSPKYPNYSFIPLYYGDGSDLSDEFSNFIGINNRTQYLIETGNSDSQVAVATAAATTTELDTTSTQLHNIDTGYLDQADSAIDALDTSSVDTLLSTNDFVATANWLSTQITNFLGVNNVFSTVVYFSLVLGIILVVLGRMR